MTAKDTKQSVADYYAAPSLGLKILAGLHSAGKNPHAFSRDDLITFEEFHIRGRESTRELARLAKLQPDMRVLDIGCGIGGPARTLAAEFDCNVVGIDLSQDYCQTAAMLTERTGLGNSVSFGRGDGIALPFADESFDVVMTQHVTMNIPAKRNLFKEIYRVLRQEGRYVLFEVCRISKKRVHLPVPWADNRAISFLLTADKFQEQLVKTDFEEVIWRDVSLGAQRFLKRVVSNLDARPPDEPFPLSLQILMGDTYTEKLVNLNRNLEEDRIVVFQGVFERP